MKPTATKVRAIRALIGLAIKNLNALSAEDKEATGITDAIYDAEMRLGCCYCELSELLKAKEAEAAQ